jgi:NitT/TauT family transport system ATP-binding protein
MVNFMHELDVRNIGFTYGEGFSIIDNVTFSADKFEFVSIIGPSGCGKSTLLRIIAGLIPSQKGEIFFFGKRVNGPTNGISFVFQDFALMPWLTNIENVKLGLEITNMTEENKDKLASDLLKKFGLEGFETAYPNVLSGGMKQRVGIARAIAASPKVLLMDEPFSSLDELTANELRDEVLYLLKERSMAVETVIMVTHNVEEAVELSDRVVVLANKPSYVKKIVNIDFKRPRNRESKEFLHMVDKLYAVLTD